MYLAKVLVLLCLLASTLVAQVLPESSHPYKNDCDEKVQFSQMGALGLEVKFAPETYVENNQDFIEITDGENQVLGRYTGASLAGQTIHISGDTFGIHLVSDSSKVEYGYKVAAIRNIASRDYYRSPESDYTRADKLFNRDLKGELYNLVKNHVSLGYDGARKKMFSEIDNESGYVRCVYTARTLKTSGIPDGNNMNTEHTWPKSLGASSEPAKSDMHHLFPTDSETNSRRSSYDFGLLASVTWSKGGSSLGKSPSGETVFLPREDHRGNAARALFYFSIRYKLAIANDYEAILKRWHEEDPIDSKEMERNEKISQYQKNRNPFIDHPEYVSRIEDF